VAVATITLESSNGDSVVVSAPNDVYLVDDIILDTNPDGLYDTSFTVRTASGAFEKGGRIIGESVPIREMVLPFWLTPESRPRFQKLWGTPGNFNKVQWHYDGPSGRRSLTLKLAKEIRYTTEDGFDATVDNVYHAVVSALAVNPMYESAEDVQEWSNGSNGGAPSRTVNVVADGGTFTLTFGGHTTAAIAYNAAAGTVQTKLTDQLGAGTATVTGTAKNYAITFTAAGTLTASAANLWSGLLHLGPKSVTIGYSGTSAYFEVSNPTDQELWLEWELDPGIWSFPDFAFGQERKWGRTVGQDAARMIVTPLLTQLLSVMSDPMMDTYVSADLSNAAGLFNGVEPIYSVPPYTETVTLPVICHGPSGSKATLRQRRFWSAESGLE
jgi:hypothetical protein